ncbi:signal-induced proliferation-associated 1-like protein 3 isoform X2 [Brachyhypopomus gauderio]|uniref:signal-induced proliferation-associated 1-like protein 3 isoform X2 n=1 Tax=Brachyhypopomus gauderio TaxID=698409 RepID=UPI004041F205
MLRLNTLSENDNKAPRAVLNYGKEVETENQHNQPECYSHPRAHFLHPCYFDTAAESSTFSPHTQYHKFRDRGLLVQCSGHSGNYGFITQSSRPHPLAQPGFYSPKIPRSKRCEPSLFSAKPVKVCSETNDFYTHTLPLSHSEIAVLKQRLCCDYPQSSQSHGGFTQGNEKLKDPDKKMNQSKVRRNSSDVRNSFASNNKESRMDTNSVNVFGQPRVIASLRSTSSPHRVRRSTIVEDLKKLIVMDDITDSSPADPTSLQQTKAHGSSSENQLSYDSASPSPLMSVIHDLCGQPLCRPSNLSLQSGPIVCQSRSGLAESEARYMDLQFDHGLRSLSNTTYDLDRIKGAEVHEIQREVCSGKSPVQGSPAYSCLSFAEDSLPVSGDTDNVDFGEISDPLSHLERTLRRLSCDLVKEKKNKVALLAEVLKLRVSNQYLKEESLSTKAQLQNIYQMFNISPGCTD